MVELKCILGIIYSIVYYFKKKKSVLKIVSNFRDEFRQKQIVNFQF